MFYYGWYGTPEFDGKWLHWDHERLPHWNPSIAKQHSRARHDPAKNDVGSTFYPKDKFYSSHDPKVVADHMVQIRRSGAGVLAVSWYPPGQHDNEGRESNALIPLLLEKAAPKGLKIAFHVEPYKGRSPESIRRDIGYLLKTYGSHPAFYREKESSLPLLYVYDSYLIETRAWGKLLRKGGELSIRGTPLDAIMIGLVVEETHLSDIQKGGWDGFYTYFAADKMSYGSTWRNFPSMAAFARRERLVYIPSVGPGYDDVEVRPWNAQTTRDRRNGDYFREALGAARRATRRFVSITSFNEWHEGTNVETAIAGEKRQDGGRPYRDYGPKPGDEYKYLDLIREFLVTPLYK
jgi:glycoprotein endo-alpha-1,2-mannosidase